MNNFSYHKKYHYALKYFVLAFPLLVFIVALISRNESAYQFVDYISESLLMLSQIEINSWYSTIIFSLGLIGLMGNPFINILIFYPLYILWVYIIDLLVDLFTLLPKMAHYFLNKLGGEKYYDK